jgi:hypothetical protein
MSIQLSWISACCQKTCDAFSMVGPLATGDRPTKRIRTAAVIQANPMVAAERAKRMAAASTAASHASAAPGYT